MLQLNQSTPAAQPAHYQDHGYRGSADTSNSPAMKFDARNVKLDVRELIVDLQGIASSWKNLGTMLGFEYGSLKEIETDNNKAGDCLRVLCDNWGNKKPEKFFLHDLLTALCTRTVGRTVLAAELEKKYKRKFLEQEQEQEQTQHAVHEAQTQQLLAQIAEKDCIIIQHQKEITQLEGRVEKAESDLAQANDKIQKKDQEIAHLRAQLSQAGLTPLRHSSLSFK